MDTIDLQNTDEKFADLPIQRDFSVCEKCRHFHKHDDNTFGCGNVYKQYGHPWCKESRTPLKKEWFVKANIFIKDEADCPNLNK